ncbi:hypothetical protein A4G99_16835 [Haladaptatus sp. R4]|uniref:hypothetical protein n=1 Tax=Haladaptatus sp. R4 TaxID=1679489 RepID=UPI0007B4EE3D|nr:hypothetical protein [Haladaptatus sp. R4]KZN22787.1 hypothetical protein A4G99_16835 [Haladaptatus sp. R4]
MNSRYTGGFVSFVTIGTMSVLVLAVLGGTVAAHAGHGSTPTSPLEPTRGTAPGWVTFAIGEVGVAIVLVTGVLHKFEKISMRVAGGGLAVGALFAVAFALRLFLG